MNIPIENALLKVQHIQNVQHMQNIQQSLLHGLEFRECSTSFSSSSVPFCRPFATVNALRAVVDVGVAAEWGAVVAAGESEFLPGPLTRFLEGSLGRQAGLQGTQ
jgi:hypothetical protein